MAPTTRRGPNTPVNNTNPNNMTPESIQAMIDQALLRNSTNGDGSHSSHEDNRRNVQTARPCFYTDFMKCQPLNFKGTEGVVGLTRWIEKMESVFNISGCAIENQVKFATCTLLGAALTWWNGQIRTLGPEAYTMTWEVLKKKMTDKYCPQGEIKKLEMELWNLKVKGNDVLAYTERFQELTLICTKFVANETEKVDKYISGLPDNIYGNVKSARPKTLDETIELANDLMDQKLRTYAERQSDNKRKADDSSRNNHGHQQQPFKRQNVAKVYNMGTGERKPYGGSLPKCTKCHLHHNGPCTQKCHKCNKVGHFARDCRSTGNTNVANTQKGNGAAPKGNGTQETNINAGTQDTDSDSEVDEQVIVVPSFPSNSFAGPSSSNGPSVMERNADYAEELAKLQRQEYEAKDAAARYGYLFSQETAEILSQAEAEIRNQGVSTDRDPAGIDSAGGVSAGSTSAGSDPAGGNPAGSFEPADKSNPAVSSSVSADFNPVYADESTLPPGQPLGSCW
ncbi:putative reverse transcriptase domain-containing protein [Tanacetum coccineum]